MQMRDRDIQLVAAGEFKRQELFFAIPHVHAGQALIAPDTVLRVHYRIADLEFR